LNDNGGGGQDAQISQPLPVNTNLAITRPFIIVATPLANFVTGAYTLQLEKLSSLDTATPEVQLYRAPSRVTNDKNPRRAIASRAMWRRPVPREQ
jgi:hypothetical protein